MTQTDLFTVMNDVAREATVHAAQTRDNPQIDIAFANDQLKRVIKKAWDDHGMEVGEKGATFNGLPHVVQAARELVRNTQLIAGMNFNQGNDVPVPGAEERKQLRDTGKDIVHARFKLKAVG